MLFWSAAAQSLPRAKPRGRLAHTVVGKSLRFPVRTTNPHTHGSRAAQPLPGVTNFVFRFSSFADLCHQSRITSHESRLSPCPSVLSVVKTLLQVMASTRIYLSLGSNLGDRAENLARGIAALGAAGIRVLRQSSLYETEPVDFFAQNWFLNNVVEAETQLLPRQLLHELRRIERALGSRKLVLQGPRALDIDLLFYGAAVIHAADLEVPHPRLAERRFVLVPLAELAPALPHPLLRCTVAELLAGTTDRSRVRRVAGSGP